MIGDEDEEEFEADYRDSQSNHFRYLSEVVSRVSLFNVSASITTVGGAAVRRFSSQPATSKTDGGSHGASSGQAVAGTCSPIVELTSTDETDRENGCV